MESAIQFHGSSVLDELLGHPVRFPGLRTCGIVRENEARTVHLQPGRIRPSFGARDVVGEDFKTVRIEVDPVGALGLRWSQHRATFCIEERLDESDLPILEIDLTQAQRGDLAAPSARRYRERQVSVERKIDGRDVVEQPDDLIW